MNSKAVSTYMGHASITITLDRYDMFPGNEAEAANLLDAYIAARARKREREAQHETSTGVIASHTAGSDRMVGVD